MRKFSFLLVIIILLVSLVFSQQSVHRGKRTTTSPSVDFISDTFTEASDIDVASHTGELGASWTHHPHANYTTSTNIDSATDRIFSTGTSAYYASGISPDADYEVEADFVLRSVATQSMGICARMDTTADTMYLGRLTDGASWQLRKIVATVATTLGTSTNQIPSVGSFKTGKLVVVGNQISFYVNGILEIGPITDSSITAIGRAGFRNNGAASSTTGTHLDNFKAR